MRTLPKLAVFVSLALSAACAIGRSSPDPVGFEPAILDAAANYTKWRRVSDRANWAPTMCRDVPSDPKMSESEDESTHGRKLYHLYAKDGSGYLCLSDRAKVEWLPYFSNGVPVGQVIVKQSWLPVEIDPKEIEGVSLAFGTEHDGKLFVTGDRGPLFIMMKLDPATPDTDDGWVYATLTPDGKTVTASGRIASCMECHASAPHERLFGIR